MTTSIYVLRGTRYLDMADCPMAEILSPEPVFFGIVI